MSVSTTCIYHKTPNLLDNVDIDRSYVFLSKDGEPSRFLFICLEVSLSCQACCWDRINPTNLITPEAGEKDREEQIGEIVNTEVQ